MIGAETLSRTLDLTDRTTCVLFGDGAGAVLLEPSDEPGVIASTLELDGDRHRAAQHPAGRIRGAGERRRRCATTGTRSA